ncbi:AbrB/MazE/SpoVT family DNA-binding domain-containing protein [Rhodopseudomonas pseudopalustris]|uniref:Transcriptional regulator AbrB n=2 Tax=Rhodopseudomonas TaxID=1073 RepID=Q133L4_RHOPS|nr:AbrB/MazE/SpoVT family DNA-binding domain-containing protein [Rhodopseudomonas pseudopalustris]ABE40725.1 Transcriptional regulator AbrB [Rhodopseudomonas palustris BisB5]MBB1091458.1 AbrB/MazE/SpoVT family DNA-binding domain-containing protein [Rhodopseudomonas palustris]SEO55685.1 looped-hinge helix DNA binding domain-containing protein, AbrB family [Rhodopseudomonas pseudopalustris]
MSYKASATLTSKGQVTLPAPIRERLGVTAGDRLDFDLSASGKLTVTAVKRRSIFENFDEVRLPSRGRARTRKDIDDAIAATVAEKFPRAGRRRG